MKEMESDCTHWCIQALKAEEIHTVGQEVKRLSINNIEKRGHHSFSIILKNLRLLTVFISQGIKTGQILHTYILSELMAAGIMGTSVLKH